MTDKSAMSKEGGRGEAWARGEGYRRLLEEVVILPPWDTHDIDIAYIICTYPITLDISKGNVRKEKNRNRLLSKSYKFFLFLQGHVYYLISILSYYAHGSCII